MRALTISSILLATYLLAGPLYGGLPPITGLPDYNGTYWGTPNTGGNCDAGSLDCDSLSGRKMFSTLYRDNYAGGSGCEGEGCGKHPGVDIAVVSGTPVVASLAGEVELSECNASWGGLIVIRATSPYDASEEVRIAYAHLKERSVKKGDTVTQGQLLGRSGGDTSDVCHGSSDGAHLHFQVDRAHGGTYPWFPTGRVEDADTDFEVAGKTYNPLNFVKGYAYNFTFADAGFKEYWGAANVNDYNTAASDLWIDSESSYPYVGRSSFFGNPDCGQSAPCSREITLEADIFTTLVLRLDFKCYNNPAEFFYRGADNVWHAGSFTYSGARKYTFDLSSLSGWNGIVKDIIIKPSQGCAASPGPEEYFIKQAYFLP